MPEIKNLIKTISKKEWIFVFFSILLLLILTSAPYIYGYFNTPEEKFYLGFHFVSMGDIPVYYSYIEQVRDGNFLFENLFTSEPQAKFLNIFWLAIGIFAKIFSLSARLAFQLSRLLLIPFFVIFLYIFIAYFFQDKIKRKLILIFILFTSGIGGLLAGILDKLPVNAEKYGYYNWPMDLWVAESNTFFTLYHTPHFIASLLLIIAVFFFALLAIENKKIKYSLAGGVCALALFQFHPYHVPTIALVLLIYVAGLSIRDKKIKWNALGQIMLIGLISFPSFAYHFYLLQTDYVTAAKANLNVTLTTSPILTVISYGFLLVFALIGAAVWIKHHNFQNKKLFIMVWMFVQFLAIYLPLNWQRRLTEGLQIPMAMLAICGIIFFIAG